MSLVGWGGFGTRHATREREWRSIAQWSANTSTIGTTPNRIVGAEPPSLLQVTAADQPPLVVLADGSPALYFDGVTDDLKLVPSAGLRLVGPRVYWAWHVRMRELTASCTLWSEWGTTERFQVALDVNAITVSVALTSTTLASVTFTVLQAVQRAGMFLEVLYDANQANVANRIRLFVNASEVTPSSSVGTLPQVLLTGNAVSNWLGSLNGASNLPMNFAHFYVTQGIPSTAERATIAASEAPSWADPGSTNGAITAWFQNVTFTGDVLGIPDLINSVVMPPISSFSRPTGNADGSMTLTPSYCLVVAPTAATNQLVTWGWAGGLKGTGTIIKYGGGTVTAPSAGDSHLLIVTAAGAIQFTIYTDGTATVSRTATTPTGLVTSTTPAFVTCECNMAGATEADKVTITVNGTLQTLTWTGAGTLGTALIGSPVNFPLFNLRTTSTAGQWVGKVSRNFYFLGAKMASATEGLLTSSARTGLKNFHPIT